jgi:hypothetical protein
MLQEISLKTQSGIYILTPKPEVTVTTSPAKEAPLTGNGCLSPKENEAVDSVNILFSSILFLFNSILFYSTQFC